MKRINFYLALCAIFALMLAGCSKDDTSPKENPDETSYVELSFEAAINDLVNRAASVTKDHFNQIPDCSDGTPSVARIQFSYGGSTFNVDLDISFDGTVYFTDYSEDLKIPVANNGSTTVTLEEFMVYDGDPDGDGKLIWIAPISSEEGQFDGYVDNPLPFDIIVRDGTKPYIPVEVLCYDNRMVNEYGYVFFDLENTELIEFCIFGNFCPPSGRHYLASYSVKVYTVDDEGNNTADLYPEGIMNSIEGGDGEEYSSDPVCIVLPDRLGEEDRYRIEIRIQDGPNYDATDGELIRTTILSDEEVRTFFDGDGNIEYFHFFEGCDEPDTPPIFDDPRDDAMTYKTCAKAINDSGVIALAAVTIDGNNLDVTILATGMAPGMEHAQHIHGLDLGDATCPPDEADTNSDGLISLDEGAPFYGAPRLFLYEEGTTFPTPSATGNYIYERSFTLTAQQKAQLTPMYEKVVVLHGMPGMPSLPVACGEFQLVE
ncbi:hypothetical protein [Christiangramia sp. SM2212]|uniref:CHRD domain-containing protein n=1 Tax=Christiangramia sediminicola TaxID=3073267 RepID=A0ABU1EQE9_9FLAO|nr:hypothetical protein [Christiangramia sp. SM2212]MDR5590613.1 hypothetical protein [Christiangramia sp. SM2212]